MYCRNTFFRTQKKTVADNNSQNKAKIEAVYKKILEYYANKPQRNILIITKILNNDFLDYIKNNFFENEKNLNFIPASAQNNGNEIILQVRDAQNKVAPLKVSLSDSNSKEFCDHFSITDIFVIASPNFSPIIMLDSLRNCGRSVQLLQVTQK